ncbi:MAG: 3-dehydroquinate synthase, partial [Pseudolabrys sp.]
MTAPLRQSASRETVVPVALGERAYDIVIGRDAIETLGARINALRAGAKVAILTDENVARAHLARVTDILKTSGIESTDIVVAPGEGSKSYATFETVCEAIIAARIERNDLIIALGGGVIGDLAGFAAASVRRGLDFVQVPTSLLAMVDSSVGGKTGINHPLGKNMIGAFYQPRLVLADTAVLKTLPPRELSAGLAEVIKHGLIRDPAFFAWLEHNVEKLLACEAPALAHAVQRCCEIKAAVVGADERETGVRALLNFGHTFGHAIESGVGFGNWLHGEAVAAGMVMAADLSRRMGLLAEAE